VLSSAHAAGLCVSEPRGKLRERGTGSTPCQNWTALITPVVSGPRLTAADVTRRAPAKPLILKDPPFVHDVLFFDFGLLPPILDAVAREGYDTPTPLQSQASGRQILLRLLRADRRAA